MMGTGDYKMLKAHLEYEMLLQDTSAQVHVWLLLVVVVKSEFKRYIIRRNRGVLA